MFTMITPTRGIHSKELFAVNIGHLLLFILTN